MSCKMSRDSCLSPVGYEKLPPEFKQICSDRQHPAPPPSDSFDRQPASTSVTKPSFTFDLQTSPSVPMPVVNGMTGAHASKVNEFEMMKAREEFLEDLLSQSVIASYADEYMVALENELEANVRRFHAMYGHARELAREVSRLEVLVQKKDDMAVLLLENELKAHHLYQQQRQLF